MEKVRVGIIGAGMIAHRSHAEAFQLIPEAEVVAVADVDRGRAQAMAEKYEIPQLFTSYEEMLAQADLDAVSVALPVFLHAPAPRRRRWWTRRRKMAGSSPSTGATVSARGR